MSEQTKENLTNRPNKQKELLQYVYQIECENASLQGRNNELVSDNGRLKRENYVLRERLEIITQANKSIKEEAAAMRKLLIKLADKL